MRAAGFATLIGMAAALPAPDLDVAALAVTLAGAAILAGFAVFLVGVIDLKNSRTL